MLAHWPRLMTLKRDGAIETLLAGSKHHALSAAANLLEQFVIAEVHQHRRGAAGMLRRFVLRRLRFVTSSSGPRPVSSRQAPQECCGESGGMAAPHLRQNLAVVILIARPFPSLK